MDAGLAFSLVDYGLSNRMKEEISCLLLSICCVCISSSRFLTAFFSPPLRPLPSPSGVPLLPTPDIQSWQS